MITAQIASIPSRVDGLEMAVSSLAGQVDLLFVALKNYEEAPPFLVNNRKIVYVLMDDSLGDAAKFYDVDQRSGYVLICDDDLAYPQGYARYMVNGIKEHGGIVSLSGRRYDEPFAPAHRGYDYKAHVNLNSPKEVHLGGTGCMAFHTDNFKISTDDFLNDNMADLWVAKAAKEQGVRIMVLPHPDRYVVHFGYATMSMEVQDSYLSDVINSFLK